MKEQPIEYAQGLMCRLGKVVRILTGVTDGHIAFNQATLWGYKHAEVISTFSAFAVCQ